jgi:hypothetical protein
MWTKYTIDNDSIYFWKIGNIEFWIRKINKEWQIATKSVKEDDNKFVTANIVSDSGNLEWKSFIADKTRTLTILPAMPDRPLVLRPQNTLKLLPEMSVQLYVHIPVWIQLYSGTARKENLICEFANTTLSSTWFGDPDNGVLSYSLPDDLNTSFEKSALLSHKVLCPLKITNNAASILDFQRLSLQVEFFNIYAEKSLLFTNEIKVKFKGENNVSDISYSNQAPSFITNSKLISAARNLERNSVLKKSFHFIKSLTDY